MGLRLSDKKQGALFVHEKMFVPGAVRIFTTMSSYPQVLPDRVLQSKAQCLALLSENVLALLLRLCSPAPGKLSTSHLCCTDAIALREQLAIRLRPQGLPKLPSYGCNKVLPMLQHLKPVWTLLRDDDKFGAWSEIESSLHEYWRQRGSQSLTPDRVTKFIQEQNLDNTRSNRNRILAIYKSILEKMIMPTTTLAG
jgi:hypothetical protein